MKIYPSTRLFNCQLVSDTDQKAAGVQVNRSDFFNLQAPLFLFPSLARDLKRRIKFLLADSKIDDHNTGYSIHARQSFHPPGFSIGILTRAVLFLRFDCHERESKNFIFVYQNSPIHWFYSNGIIINLGEIRNRFNFFPPSLSEIPQGRSSALGMENMCK